MSGHLGDFDASAVVYGKFTTFRPSTGAPFTLAGTPALSVYKDNSTTQSTTGVTLSADFDSVTGLHHFAIDTSADGTFYAAGSFFDVVITAGSVDSVSVVGTVVGSFTLRKTSALKPTTAGRALDVSAGGEAGVDWANVGSPTTTLNLSGTTVGVTASVSALANNTITASAIASDAITAAKIADGAITAAKVADGAIDAATFAAGAINAAAIADGAIDAATFAAGAINAAAIASDAITASKIADGAIDAATFAASAIDATALATSAAQEIADTVLTRQMTESYAANGVAPTLAQAMFAVHQYLMQFGVASTSYTVKKLDNSTSAFVVTLNDATTPTGAART